MSIDASASSTSMVSQASVASLVSLCRAALTLPEQDSIVKLVEKHDEYCNVNRREYFAATKPKMIPRSTWETYQDALREWQSLSPGLSETEKHVNKTTNETSRPDLDNLEKYCAICEAEIEKLENVNLENIDPYIRNFRCWLIEQFRRLRDRILRIGWEFIRTLSQERAGSSAPEWAINKVRDWVKQHEKGHGVNISNFAEIKAQFERLHMKSNEPNPDQTPSSTSLTPTHTPESSPAHAQTTPTQVHPPPPPPPPPPPSGPAHNSGVYSNPPVPNVQPHLTTVPGNPPAWQAGTQNFAPTAGTATPTTSMAQSQGPNQFATGPSMGQQHPPGH